MINPYPANLENMVSS